MHWRSLGLDLVPYAHCWVTADKVSWSVRQESQRAGGFQIEVAFSLVKRLIWSHTCSVPCCASTRPSEQAGTQNGAAEPHKSNPLTQRLTWMETDGHIPSSGGQRFTFPSLQMSQSPSLPPRRHGITHVPLGLTKADVAAKSQLLGLHVHTLSQREIMSAVMNEWPGASRSWKTWLLIVVVLVFCFYLKSLHQNFGGELWHIFTIKVVLTFIKAAFIRLDCCNTVHIWRWNHL